MKKKLLLLFCIILFSVRSDAQTKSIERLQLQLKMASSDAAKRPILFALCEQRNSLSAQHLRTYALQAETIARKQHLSEQTMLAGYYVATSLEKGGQPDSAARMVAGMLKEAKGKFSDRVYRKLLYLKGTLLIRKNEYKDALAIFFDLLKQSEKQQDTLSEIGATGAIGWTYMEMGQLGEARQWFGTTLEMPVNNSYRKYFAATYINLSAVQGMLGHYDSVEYYVNEAIKIAEEHEMLTFLCNALNVKASLYMMTDRNPLAEAPLARSLAIRKQIGDPFYVVADMAQLSSYYANAHQPDKALSLAQEGVSLATQNKIYGKLPILHHAVAHAYKLKGDLRNYSIAIEKEIAIRDSLSQADLAGAIAELEAKYNLQKKENTIILQELELVKQDYLLVASLVLIIALSAGGFFIFRNYRTKQRRRIRRMLEEEKLQAARAVKEAEESERKRIAADLHDNLGAYAASIAYNLEAVIAGAAGTNPALAELKSNAQAMVAELSDTIWALKKDALQLTAISDRIKVFVQKLQATYTRFSFDVQEHIIADVLLPPSQAFHLLRIIQEAINNAVKHSNGDSVMVILRSDTDWNVLIADNGKGMNGHATSAETGNGLYNMQRRAAACFWKIDWQSENAGGTQVQVRPAPTTN